MKTIARDSSTSEIKEKAISTVKWVYFGEIVARLAQPLTFLILAKLLVPQDFGLVSIAIIAISFAQNIQDFGLSKALIQRKTKIPESANVSFWVSALVGIVLYATIFICSPYFAQFFSEPKLVDVLRVLCIQIVLVSLTTVHLSLLQRNFNFYEISIVRICSSVIPGIVSIPLAVLGYGAWSIVWGSLAASCVQLVLFWHLSKWRPNLQFDLEVLKELSSFGTWVILEMILAWLINQGDSIIIGHFLGTSILGIFTIGSNIVLLVYGFVFSPIIPMVYAAFSRISSSLDELKSLFLQFSKILATFSLPMGLGLTLLAYPLYKLVLNDQWDGITLVIASLGISSSLLWLVGINNEVFRAIGKPNINVVSLCISIAVALPLYILAAGYGLTYYCVAKVVAGIFGLLLNFYLVNRVLGLPVFYMKYYITAPLISTLVMGLSLLIMLSVLHTFDGVYGLICITLLFAIGVISYFSALFLLDRTYVNGTLITIVRSAIKRAN